MRTANGKEVRGNAERVEWCEMEDDIISSGQEIKRQYSDNRKEKKIKHIWVNCRERGIAI